MSGFFQRHGPAELILQILSKCDSVGDCIALVLSCRRIAEVWNDNNAGAAIVWKMKLHGAPSIDDALVAVRL